MVALLVMTMLAAACTDDRPAAQSDDAADDDPVASAERTSAFDDAAPMTVAAGGLEVIGTETDGRPILDGSELVGVVILDRPDVVVDFGFVVAERDITIAASNVEARNIRGSGARRVGARDGRDYVDSGFRDFEFTYAQMQIGGGGDAYRPYFIDGLDINEEAYGEGSPVHMYAFEGDIHDLVIDNLTVFGRERPEDSTSHNDGIHLTGLRGGRVIDPTIRNSTLYSGAALALLARHVHGQLTIENSTFVERFGAFHAVMGDARDGGNPTLLWRNNTLEDGASAVFLSGYELHPDSDELIGNITID